MSYQPHRLNEFIPTYVPHSDYLPKNQVLDGRQADVNNLVMFVSCSSPNTSSRSRRVGSTLSVLLISIPGDTSLCELLRM